MKIRAAMTSSVAIACALVAGCALFDSGVEWRDGPYALMWIDLPDEVQLPYYLGNGGWATLVLPRVFAVGSNDQYVVACQHPGCEKALTNYFIVDKRQYVAKRGPGTAVLGPISEKEYAATAAQLRLPPFTKVLESLK